jgi:tetratricopeptide (TPR) repeat protein
MTTADAAPPVGLTYSTPSQFEVVPSPYYPEPFTPRPPDETNSKSDPVFDSELNKILPLRLTWNGYKLGDLEEMTREAGSLSEIGNLEAAEHKFREALFGFEGLLTPTHEKSISAAYELADFYAKNLRMNDADEVLQRVSENLVETWGLEHTKTIAYMLRVIDLYHAWGRSNDALTLLQRAIDYIDDPPATKKNRADGAKTDKATVKERTMYSSRHFEMPDSGGSRGRVRTLEFQLVVANAQARARDDEAEPVLLSLIEQCGKFPEQFTIQLFKAHSSLLRLYQESTDVDKLKPSMEQAKEFFLTTMKRMKKKREPPTILLLRATIDLIGCFVECGSYKASENMFDIVEKEITAMMDENEVEANDAAVDLLVDIGMVYQMYDQWRYARPRVEYALAKTIASRGPNSWKARRLQDALEKKSISQATLMYKVMAG